MNVSGYCDLEVRIIGCTIILAHPSGPARKSIRYVVHDGKNRCTIVPIESLALKYRRRRLCFLLILSSPGAGRSASRSAQTTVQHMAHYCTSNPTSVIFCNLTVRGSGFGRSFPSQVRTVCVITSAVLFASKPWSDDYCRSTASPIVPQRQASLRLVSSTWCETVPNETS
jgi:hypothetical protein